MATLPQSVYEDWEQRQFLLALVRKHKEDRQRRGHGDKHLNHRAAYEARLEARKEQIEMTLAELRTGR